MWYKNHRKSDKGTILLRAEERSRVLIRTVSSGDDEVKYAPWKDFGP